MAARVGDIAADETLGATGGLARPSSADGEPRQIGRHLIVRRLGAGTMGVVYAAYDPELDRRLALKVLVGADRQRMLREAQAMAHIDHPNVVRIFDVGVFEGEVYLAMELVEGETLGDWLVRERPGWRRVVEVFAQAGRGLAAAHAAGIVHGDFKPHNVLLDRRGAVRVADFGLASADGEVEGEARIRGTPAYMAPELLHGRPADARSDVYAFSVALYEALYGEWPFRGETLVALVDAIVHGRPTPPVARVPGWLRRVVLRGLAREPGSRFSTMEALLDALLVAPARRRRLVVVLAASLVIAALMVVRARLTPEACGMAAASLGGVWDAERRASLAGRFAGGERRYAAAAWEGVARAIDDYAAGWTAMRVEACEAAQVRGEQSLELMDRRMVCLDERLVELRRLLEVVEESDASIIAGAPTIAGSLRPLDRCADAEALLADVPPPEEPALAAAVAGERERLARVRGLEGAGRYVDAAVLAAEVVGRARELGYAPLMADALFVHGHAARMIAAPEAEGLLRDAYALAERTRYERVRLQSAIEVIPLLAEQRRFDRRADRS